MRRSDAILSFAFGNKRRCQSHCAQADCPGSAKQNPFSSQAGFDVAECLFQALDFAVPLVLRYRAEVYSAQVQGRVAGRSHYFPHQYRLTRPDSAAHAPEKEHSSRRFMNGCKQNSPSRSTINMVWKPTGTTLKRLPGLDPALESRPDQSYSKSSL